MKPRIASHLTLADWVQFILFSAMSLTYALYMAGYLAQSIYFALLVATVGYGGLRLLIRLIRPRASRRLYFGWSALAMCACAAVYILITAVRELGALGTVTSTSITESFYLVAPAVIALTVANTGSVRIADMYMTVLLIRYIVFFVLSFEFDLSSLLAISWSDSNSSAFESSFAHDLLVVECYFIYRSLRGRASVALAFTMLGFKRASFVLAPVLFVLGSRIRNAPRPRVRTLVSLGIVGTLSPFLVMWTYSDELSDAFESAFGVSLNDFASGRETIYALATNHLPNNLGFGWLNQLLGELTHSAFGTIWNSNLHNETLRLYLEVGLIGVGIYVFALISMARWSRMSLLLITYTLFVLITSRLLTQMSFWIVLFLALAVIERDVRERWMESTPTGASRGTDVGILGKPEAKRS